MDGKIYVFGIGGTGARVLKSLTMLAACGVDLQARSIVPIIVDPDFANADVTRTVELLKDYNKIREKLDFTDATKNRFFKIPIERICNDYRLQINDTTNKKFKEFIDYNILSLQNKALVSALFSEKNLDSDMQVGFKGNPNVGSIVLNQFAETNDFVDFLNGFIEGDRIFIISSIFGGTGASGFPLLLKTLRGLDRALPNWDAIRRCPIGAITVVPYFAVRANETSEIDSSTFIGKTKAALQYYSNNMSGKESAVNALYYIGDKRQKQYENSEGGNTQRNNAHVVELAAALAIADFISIPDGDEVLSNVENEQRKTFAGHPVFKEYGIEDDVPEILFSNLSRNSKDLLCAPMTRFVLLSKYLKEQLIDSLHLPWAQDNGFTRNFVQASFVSTLDKYCESYMQWLSEMSDNDRSFKPYNLSVKDNDLYSIVNGVHPASIKALWALGKNGYSLFDVVLGQQKSHSKSTEQKFMDMLYSATEMIIKKKFNF